MSENEVVQAVPVADIEKFDRGSVDLQIATAKRYPRVVADCVKQAKDIALIDADTAASCFYVLARKGQDGGKKIEGPGVRLAAIVTSTWGNMRVGQDVLGESDDRRFIIARGFAWDLEKNVAFASTVRRRITDKHGKRYSDDMIQTTGMAAASIAFRNSVFKVIPGTVTGAVYEAAKKLAVGDNKTLQEKKQWVTQWLRHFGVANDRLFAKIEKKSMDEINVEDIALLTGLITTMREGTDPEEVFPKLHEDTAPKGTLQDKVAATAAKIKPNPDADPEDQLL